MTDLPILTPSECAKLAKIEAKMTPGPWRSGGGLRGDDGLYFGEFDLDDADYDGLVELRNAAPRMLATIAAHEATIADLRKQLRAQEEG